MKNSAGASQADVRVQGDSTEVHLEHFQVE